MTYQFTREELYELVWSKPMSKFAKELGVSDVAIAKACKRIDIPTPGPGYWAKAQHGKKVKRSPLPPPTPQTPAIVQISPGASKSQLCDLASEVQEKIARESTDEWRIAVPKTLSNLHPIVRTWLMKARYPRERNRPSHEHPHPFRRHARIERRRLRILSALFRALEKRGHQVVANPRNLHDVALIVDGERFEFRLAQSQRQFKKDLTSEELTNPMNAASASSQGRSCRQPSHSSSRSIPGLAWGCELGGATACAGLWRSS